MTLYEAVFESMSMVSTGGFGLYSSNLAHYNSDALKAIVALVLLVSSSSFILHYRFFSSGVFSVYVEDKEWTLYLLLLLFVLLVLGSVDCFFGVGVASADLLFTVVSMLSTAGHQSVVTTWPVSVAFLLMVMSLLGGCSGSTSGGIKVLRWRFLWRDFTNALRGQLHPQAVFADSLDNSQVVEMDNPYPNLTPNQSKTLTNALNRQKDFMNGEQKKVGRLTKKDANIVQSMEESGVEQKSVGSEVGCFRLFWDSV